jgi:hypothetical protein
VKEDYESLPLHLTEDWVLKTPAYLGVWGTNKHEGATHKSEEKSLSCSRSLNKSKCVDMFQRYFPVGIQLSISVILTKKT